LTYPEALQYLNRFVNYERFTAYRYLKAFSLDRVKHLLDRLKSPHQAYPTLHVAGTKGKGSTCAFAASILSALGWKVGLYTSPHLWDLRERIQVGAKAISESELAEVMETIRCEVKEDRAFTYFEILTACAFLHFRNVRVDLAVVEVGMGGRLDATNVVSPSATAITPIGLDHMPKLGWTLPAIAREKAGIIKPGVPVVVAPQPNPALKVIEEVARLHRAPFHRMDKEVEVSDLRVTLAGGCATFKTPYGIYRNLTIPLLGEHQIVNAAVAIRLVECFCERIGRPLEESDRNKVALGLASTRWPLRCQLLQSDGRMWMLDGAQSAHSAQALRQTVETILPNRRVWLLLGFSTEKDLSGIMEAWRGWPHRVIATQSSSVRAEPAWKVAQHFAQLTPHTPVAVVDSIRKALELARSESTPDDLIVVAGSLFLAAEAFSAFSGAFV